MFHNDSADEDVFIFQENRRAERATEQRVRAEKERHRQARIAVISTVNEPKVDPYSFT